MSRSVGKVILSAACAGVAIDAVLHYIMKNRSSRSDFQNDFEGFTDGFEGGGQRRYTTLPHSPQGNETAAS